MPTGVALRDARQQLFDAAERVLLRDGLSGLTSRAVTTEAGCAKGVLHRYFSDFDAFLADLVLDRTARVDGQAATLRDATGTGTVAGNLTRALQELFGPLAQVILGRPPTTARRLCGLRGGRPPGSRALRPGRRGVEEVGRVTKPAESVSTTSPNCTVHRVAVDIERTSAIIGQFSLAPNTRLP